ncbi:MAG TPA: hypothetical protein VGF06_13705 [Terriglobales bacterium]|jgi:hypothetical protein
MDTSHYQQLSDDEILNIARDEADLTDEAKTALALELSRRNIASADIQTYSAETQVLEAAEEQKRAQLLASRHNRKFLGKANFVSDHGSGSEEYDATLWLVAFWFPWVPLGSYRVRRNRAQERWWNIFDPNITILHKLPLNWEQILRTWLIAACILFAVFLTLPRLLPFIVNLVDHLNHQS